jgi:hypothetical protein
MDPNANLLEQEHHIAAIAAHDRAPERATERERKQARFERAHLCADKRQLQRALTEWLDRGGFEPNWSKAPNARKYYGK